MNFLTSIFRRKNLSKFNLKYNKRDSEWVVMKSNDSLYVGSQRQCEKFIDRNYDAFI